MANFDNVYHFMLGDGERVRAPTDAPYTAKSSALLSDRSVRKHFNDYCFILPSLAISCVYLIGIASLFCHFYCVIFSIMHPVINFMSKVGFADQQFVRPVYKRSYRIPRDPRFREQWHLVGSLSLCKVYCLCEACLHKPH